MKRLARHVALKICSDTTCYTLVSGRDVKNHLRWHLDNLLQYSCSALKKLIKTIESMWVRLEVNSLAKQKSV